MMSSTLEPRRAWIRRAGIAAACALICAGGLMGGMDKAASASLFGLALSGLLALVLVLTPGARLKEVAKIHAAPILAALLFVAWCLFTAWLEPVEHAAPWRQALFHPLWAVFDSPSGAVSIAPYRTLEGLAAFLGPASAFLLGALLAEGRGDRDLIGRLYAPGAIILAGFALYELLTGGATNNNRLMAPFGSSNAAATMFGVFAIVCAAFILRAARGRLSGVRTAEKARLVTLVQRIPVTLAAFTMLVACMLLTGSRAGIACFVGALALFFALTRTSASRTGRGQAGFAFVAAVAAVLLLIGGDFILSRFGTFGVDAEARRMMIETHWGAFLDRPWVGHGLNTFHELNAYYATLETWPALRNIGAAHNIFVQMLEETGIVGAALFMLMMAPPIARALQISVEARSGSEWAAAAVAATAFVFAHGLVDFGFQVPSIAAALTFALGAFSSGRMAERRREQPAPEPDPQAPMRFRPPEEEKRAAA